MKNILLSADGDISLYLLKEEIFESLKISELIYKKSLEEDKTVHHDIFFGYVKQLVQERNRN